MGLPITPQPTLDGYLNSWLYGTVGIPVEWLPSTNEWIFWSYNTAIATVHPFFKTVPGPIYLQMVYNLATHILIVNSPDVMTTPPFPYKIDPEGPFGFFGWYRKQNKVNSNVAGTVNSSSDNGTSVSLTVPRQAENLTLSQVQLQTTPYGRAYLGLAQSIGTNWGIS